MSAARHKTFRSRVVKLTRMTRWSRHIELNDVREVRIFVQGITKDQYEGSRLIMKNVVNAPKRGWKLKPDRKWDGKTKDFGLKL